jgi:hypothetical protein
LPVLWQEAVTRVVGVLPVVWMMVACTSAPVAPSPPPPGLTPTACEKRALMTGQVPDVVSPQAVAENLPWGALAPETCPEAGGRLNLGPPWGRP